MRTSTAAKTLTLAVTLTLLVGCGAKPIGGNADVRMNADGTVQVENEEGTFATGNTLPSDWPTDVPAYAGATVQYSASANPANGQPGSAAVFMTTDTVANVKAFYTEQLTSNGWTIESTMEAQGTTIIGATKGDRALSLMTGANEGQTTITIGIGKK